MKKCVVEHLNHHTVVQSLLLCDVPRNSDQYTMDPRFTEVIIYAIGQFLAFFEIVLFHSSERGAFQPSEADWLSGFP